MGRDADLSDCLDDTVGVVDEMALVSGHIAEILQARGLTVVAADEGSEDTRVSEVLVEVEQKTWVHWVHLVVVVVHPLEEDGLGHGVDVTLAHRLVYIRLIHGHTG